MPLPTGITIADIEAIFDTLIQAAASHPRAVAVLKLLKVLTIAELKQLGFSTAHAIGDGHILNTILKVLPVAIDILKTLQGVGKAA